MVFVAYLLAVVATGWLIGSVPIGFLVCYYGFRVNPLKIGSGGIGETNVKRALETVMSEQKAKKWAFGIQLLDQAKGLIPILVVKHFGLPLLSVALLGCALILGHTFSVFLRFKGGKGVATTMGIGLGLFWPSAIATYVCWYAIKKLLGKKTKEATAFASIFAGFLLCGLTLIFVLDKQFLLFYVYAAFHILFAHKGNVKRFIEERHRAPT